MKVKKSLILIFLLFFSLSCSNREVKQISDDVSYNTGETNTQQDANSGSLIESDIKVGDDAISQSGSNITQNSENEVKQKEKEDLKKIEIISYINDLNNQVNDGTLELSSDEILKIQGENLMETNQFLGNYYMKKGDFKNAKLYFNKAFELSGEKNANIIFNLGVIDYNQGNPKEGKIKIDKAIELGIEKSLVDNFVQYSN